MVHLVVHLLMHLLVKHGCLGALQVDQMVLRAHQSHWRTKVAWVVDLVRHLLARHRLTSHLRWHILGLL